MKWADPLCQSVASNCSPVRVSVSRTGIESYVPRSGAPPGGARYWLRWPYTRNRPFGDSPATGLNAPTCRGSSGKGGDPTFVPVARSQMPAVLSPNVTIKTCPSATGPWAYARTVVDRPGSWSRGAEAPVAASNAGRS